MHRSFATVVAPVIEALAPAEIVEVGAGSGKLTRRVLDAAGAAEATVHAIDPVPAFDPEDLAPGDERLVLHAEPSHTALPRLGAADVALLDGDPNWHTVHGELELLAAAAREADRPPPVVVVHNVHWPFGRRDGYHDPDAVPEEARRPHAAAGLRPDGAHPVPNGLRLVPFVATDEHGERNGVMTAVEDFVAADPGEWRVIDVPGYHGVAVLIAMAAAEADMSVRGLLGALEAGATLRRAARRVEAGRIEALLTAEAVPAGMLGELEARLATALEEHEASLTSTRAEHEAQLAGVREDYEAQLAAVREDYEAQLADARERAAAAADAVESSERRLRELEAEHDRQAEAHAAAVAALRSEPERHRALHEAALWRIDLLERDLADRDAERRAALAAREEQSRAAVEASVRLERAVEDLHAARERLARLERDAADLREEGARKDAELADVAERLRMLGGRSSHLEESLGAAQAEARAAHANALVLEERLRARAQREEEIAGHVRAAAASRSWRVGHALVRFARRLTFRRAVKSEGALEVALRAIDRPQLSERGSAHPEIGSSEARKTGNVPGSSR